jgi:hypothetical protein
MRYFSYLAKRGYQLPPSIKHFTHKFKDLLLRIKQKRPEGKYPSGRLNSSATEPVKSTAIQVVHLPAVPGDYYHRLLQN